MASFGLLIPAVSVCLKKMWKILCGFFQETSEGQLKNTGKEEYFYLFCLLSMMAQLAITSIVTMSPGRLDGFVYGRYNEHLLPVFIGIGLIAVCDTGHRLFVFIMSAGISIILFGIVFWNTLHSGLTVMQGYFAAGISYLSDDWNYEIKTEFWKAYLFGIFLMALVMTCIAIGKKFGKYIYALGVVLLAEILLAFCLEKKYTKPFNDINYYNLMVARYMEEYEEPVVYLYDGGFPYIDLIQFAMRERSVGIIRIQELEVLQPDVWETNGLDMTEAEKTADVLPEGLLKRLPEEGFLLVDRGNEYIEVMEQTYKKCMESQAFILFLIE